MIKTQKFILVCAKVLAEIFKPGEEVDDDILNYLAGYPWDRRSDFQKLWPDKNAFVTYMLFHARRLA